MIDNITASMAPIASWILFASCKSILVIALVFVCRRLLARWLSPQGRYMLWFAMIACLTVPFGAQLDLDLLKSSSQATAELTIDNALQPETAGHEAPKISIGDPDDSQLQTDSSPSTQSSLTQSSLIVAWLAVALGLAAVMCRNLFRYLRIKASASEVDAATSTLFQQCKKRLNVQRAVRLLETSRIESPAIFGWWSPTLLLPRNLSSQLTAEQLRLVFLHELGHVRRHDILVNWLIAFVQIAHWFNPFVWLALRAMRADMEQACDAKVMGYLSGHEQIDYGNTLIRLLDFNPKPMFLPQGAGVVESHSQLKTRINMIAQFKPHRIVHSIFAVVLLMAVTSVAVTQPKSGQTAASDTRQVATQSVDQNSTRAPESQPAPSPVTPSTSTETQRPAAQSSPKTAATAKPTGKTSSAAPHSIKNIDFRRGGDGSGRIVVELSDSHVPTELRQENGKVIVTFAKTTLLDSLLRRLDVANFATPVSTIEIVRVPAGARLVIAADGEWQRHTRQVDNVFVVEIEPTDRLSSKSEKKQGYVGARINLDFKNTETRTALNFLADKGGVNMVISDSVQGRITLRLQDIPWDRALDIVLRTKGLDMRREGDLMIVAPVAEFAARDKERLAAQEIAPLRTEYLQVNYAKAANLAELIKSGMGGSPLSERGNISVDERTNMLLVHDTEKNIAAIRELVKTLDVYLDQILLEAHIVLADDFFSRELQEKSGSTSPSSAVTALRSDFDVVSNLTSFEAGHMEVIASPRVVTANRKEATVQLGTEIPHQIPGDPAPLKRTTLTIKLTPRITSDKKIALNVSVDMRGQEIAPPAGATLPSIDTRQVSTQVIVGDGQTIMFDDLLKQYKDGTASTSQGTAGKRRLLIFVTPKIVPHTVAYND